MNKPTRPYTNARVVTTLDCNAHQGRIVWSPAKSAWISAMYVTAIVGGTLTFSMEALGVFLASTALTLSLGHSLGMHRRFIHNSFDCPKWLEYLLVHLGVLVGIAGPLGMMRAHDMRDWAQRQTHCHHFYGQQAHWFRDGIWQLHCDLRLDHAPDFVAEESVARDPVYQFMEATWMLQQLPWAIAFFLIGGIDWVIWGICVRVAVSVTGHWLIGYLAHNRGHRSWHVDGASVQGYNVRFCALITMGESWHNNHHAYPGSALLGIRDGQTDPGWWVLRILEYPGLVWNLKRPEDLPARPELQETGTDKVRCQPVIESMV